MGAPKILIVDDEKDILEFLSYNLEKEGYEVFLAQNGKEAIKVAIEKDPNLILLDIMMPEMDGIETCEEMRKIPKLENTLIVFLTARSEDYSQIAGFEAGGDDYVAKPVKPKVLTSRIKALLRRSNIVNNNKVSQSEKKDVIEKSGLVIDRERFIVIYNGDELVLPKKEFELLALLISKPDKVFTREDIFQLVWGDDVVVGDRTIDVHIRKLREKIGDDKIKTVKGVGYKFIE